MYTYIYLRISKLYLKYIEFVCQLYLSKSFKKHKTVNFKKRIILCEI